MTSKDNQPANGEAHDPFYIVSGEEMNRIIVPLTVVHAYVQLLRRRIRENGPGEIEDLDHTLGRMEEATRTMTAELWATLGATSHLLGDTD